jgi:hypothetical protein
MPAGEIFSHSKISPAGRNDKKKKNDKKKMTKKK